MFTWTEANSWETGGYNAEQPSEMCFQIPPPPKKNWMKSTSFTQPKSWMDVQSGEILYFPVRTGNKDGSNVKPWKEKCLFFSERERERESTEKRRVVCKSTTPLFILTGEVTSEHPSCRCGSSLVSFLIFSFFFFFFCVRTPFPFYFYFGGRFIDDLKREREREREKKKNEVEVRVRKKNDVHGKPRKKTRPWRRNKDNDPSTDNLSRGYTSYRTHLES